MSESGSIHVKRNLSFLELSPQKRSSIETIFNIANSMMGTVVIVIPIFFYKSGIISSIITSLIICIISVFLCKLIMKHIRDDEEEYQDSIERILGKKWKTFFNFLSCILMGLVSIIHYILISSILYSVIISLTGHPRTFPLATEINFQNFSMQYSGIIVFIIFSFIYLYKDISVILKINDKGIYMIFLFCLFVIYLGILAVTNENIEYPEKGCSGVKAKGLDIILFNTDITQLIGVYAYAYLVHNTVSIFLRENKNKENNSRDLNLAFALVFSNYFLIGIFGSFAVAALYHHEYTSESSVPDNLMILLLNPDNDFLNSGQRFLSYICLFFVMIQLTTVLPIMNYFTKIFFYALIQGESTELTNLQHNIFNIVFNLICLGIEMLVWDPTLVIAYTGAFGGFMFAYFFPIVMHFKCIYFTSHGEVTPLALNSLSIEEDTYTINNCRAEDHQIQNKTLFCIFYSGLMLLGLGMLAVSFYQIIENPICKE